MDFAYQTASQIIRLTNRMDRVFDEYTFPVRHPRYLEHVVSIIFRQIIKHFVRCMDKSSSKF